MNHELLKTVIYDQHRVIRESEIVPREYTFEKNANYLLIGLRRAGKSTQLYRIVLDLVREGVAWERIIYINFEDERLAEFTTSDFNDILQVQSELSPEKGYFFFDEIQNVPGWEKFARRMADSRERVYITGSNAKMLSREMETILGGRYLEKIIRPYSFSEYLDARRIPHDAAAMAGTKTRGRIAGARDDYLRDGGLPESLMYSAKREYISSVFQRILLGDIVARNNIRNDLAMKLLMKKTAESVRSEISFSKLYGTLKGIGISVSKDSVIDYIGYAMDSWLIFALKNYYSAFGERESSPKYYFFDNGLLNLFLTEKSSSLLENAVALELIRRYGDAVYFIKSAQTGIDVDFFLPEQKAAIQACIALNDDSMEREVQNLVRLSERSDDANRLFIVTEGTDTVLHVRDREITVLSCERFLLNGI